MATAKLGLDRCAWSKVYRSIVDTFRADPVLAPRVRSWRTWTGEPRDVEAIDFQSLPAIMLVPDLQGEAFYGPSAFAGSLIANLTVGIPGRDADDILDFFHACHRAIYPADDARRLTIHRALVAAGAESMFSVEFTRPALGWIEDCGGWWTATGRIKVDVVSSLNP